MLCIAVAILFLIIIKYVNGKVNVLYSSISCWKIFLQFARKVVVTTAYLISYKSILLEKVIFGGLPHSESRPFYFVCCFNWHVLVCGPETAVQRTIGFHD